MKKKTSSAGFTLIETFVAITVLLTAIAGPLTIASKGLSSAMIARDQMTAFYLGQDAIEFIRHHKDTNALRSDPWLTGLSACMSTLCTVDTKEDVLTSCGTSCPPLRYNDESGFFSYNLLDDETNFTRSVKITPANAEDNIEGTVEASVSWTAVNGLVRNFTVREHLFDWQ